MAWSLPCRLCSGCCDFRKDKSLRDLYGEIKGDEKKIDALVNFSPCATVKLCLAYGDEDIAEAFVDRYSKDTKRLPECERRRELARLIGECIGSDKLPYLSSLTEMIKNSISEKTSNPSLVISGLNPREVVFGRENPGYDDAQQQAWAPLELLIEELNDSGFSLKERSHRYAGS